MEISANTYNSHPSLSCCTMMIFGLACAVVPRSGADGFPFAAAEAIRCYVTALIYLQLITFLALNSFRQGLEG